MAANSTIEWTEHTWNPVTGCTRVGPECSNCYAMNMAHRFDWGEHLTRVHKVHLEQVDGSRKSVEMVDWNGEVDVHPHLLTMPLRWRSGAKVFVCSTADLFHHRVPFRFTAAVFGVMAAAPAHTFQVLTKRPARMAEFISLVESGALPSQSLCTTAADQIQQKHLADRVRATTPSWPLPNVWLGTSVGVRAAKYRIDDLRAIPAAVRFLSLEPLLEDLGELDLSGIGWVIAGGESGARARPMHPDWVRSIRDQCNAAKVPFFFKQHGAFSPAQTHGHCSGSRFSFADGQEVVRVGKKKGGRQLDGRTHDGMPI